jgi:hypothetical protein
MSFAGKLSLLSDSQKPSLAIFGHEPGSCVYEGLFPKFQLPNGKEAFFYYASGSLQVLGGPLLACLNPCQLATRVHIRRHAAI